MGMTLTGLEALRARLTHGTAQIVVRADQMVQRAGVTCQERAQESAPVRTGELRDSIHATSAGPGKSVVAATAEYAPFVEFGTSKMAAHPFLFPAYQETKKELVAELATLRLEGTR